MDGKASEGLRAGDARTNQSRRAICSIAADGKRFSEIFSSSRKRTIICKSFPSSRITKTSIARPGIDGTLIRMVRGLDRWFWMIPLTPTRMSIGVVMDTSTFRAMKLVAEEALEKCIGEQPLILEQMTNAERVSPVYSAGDYSYRNTKLFGDRWLLAGDAAGFIDPVFSSGVFLAIMSAEKAADSLDEILRDESQAPRLFEEYSRRVNRVMDMYLTFVNSWYRGKEFVEVFLNPTDMLQTRRPRSTPCSAGNEGESFAIKWRMWVFYFFVSSAEVFCVLAAALARAEEEAPVPAEIAGVRS